MEGGGWIEMLRMKRNEGAGTEFSLELALREGKGKAESLEIAGWVGQNARRFVELLGYLSADDSVLATRASWAAGACVERSAELLAPHYKTLLGFLEGGRIPHGVMRNTFRIFQGAPIPVDCEGRVMAVAMAALGGAVPVAVKAYAMTVLRRLAENYPEILLEVRELIREQWHDASPALRARARMEFGGRGE